MRLGESKEFRNSYYMHRNSASETVNELRKRSQEFRILIFTVSLLI